MNLPTKQKQAHREQICSCQGVEEGMDWEFGISRGKLVCIGWINNKALPYSTGNYIRYPVINHNGKEYEKEYISIPLSHFSVQWKLTQHCKLIILQ